MTTTKIQPAQRVDIHTGRREQVYELSLIEKPTFHSKREAERVAKAIERALHTQRGDS